MIAINVTLVSKISDNYKYAMFSNRSQSAVNTLNEVTLKIFHEE